MPPKIIAVVGPTASGKTALAVALARRMCGEVVSCDSMQIYRQMQIGTAAPTVEEMEGIPHHMLGIAEPDAPFSCADYVARAQVCIQDIISRGKIPILCGGTGLYLDSLLYIQNFSSPEGDERIRRELHSYAQNQGAEALHARLAQVDPQAAEAIHPQNIRRVVRALEIFECSGITKTEWDRRSLSAEPRYDAFVIALDYRDRQTLYDRINRRVTVMLEEGLEREARSLYARGYLSESGVASQAIGYKELIPYFRGECSLMEAAEQIRLSSRRYAKRQLTWFRRYKSALWLYPDENGDILKNAETLSDEAEAAMRTGGWLSKSI